MADTLSQQLKQLERNAASLVRDPEAAMILTVVCRQAAAELDRREALVTAAEALQQKIQIYTDSDDNFDTGELPHLADVMSAARDVVAVLKGSHAH
jgi:hypothetical protein